MLEKIGEYLGSPNDAGKFFHNTFRARYTDYRDPEYHQNLDIESVQIWHQDCDNVDKDKNEIMIVWSNRENTEFLVGNDGIVLFSPGSIVLFNNGAVFHRTPLKISTDRHFVRAYKPNIELVTQFKARPRSLRYLR